MIQYKRGRQCGNAGAGMNGKRSVGRPKEANPKSFIVKTRLNKEKAEFVQKICTDYGLTESEALRCMIDYIYGSRKGLARDQKWVDAIRANKRREGIVIEESD